MVRLRSGKYEVDPGVLLMRFNLRSHVATIVCDVFYVFLFADFKACFIQNNKYNGGKKNQPEIILFSLFIQH